MWDRMLAGDPYIADDPRIHEAAEPIAVGNPARIVREVGA